MRSDKYLLNKIVMPAYEEMYKRATPSADIYELIESGVTKESNWYMKYYLPEDEFNEIKDKWLKKCQGDVEKRRVDFELTLGSTPTCNKEVE